MDKSSSWKLGFKGDWAAWPYLILASLGFIIAIYDFWILQNLRLQLNIHIVIGVILLITGGILRFTSRRTLMKAGFGLTSSSRLQIVKDQQLVTSGVYYYVRHPLYLGEITRNLGFAILLSSLYGMLVMVFGNIFLLFRIETEERMLLEKFGVEYEEYMKKTNKLIPYIY